MKQAKLTILNLQLCDFYDKQTGKANSLTKITYGMKITETDKFVGYSILECYANANSYNTLKNVLYKECVADIELKPTSNGVKYVISKINNESVR